MKLLAKLGIIVGVAGIGATALLAAPNSTVRERSLVSEEVIRHTTEMQTQLTESVEHVKQLRLQAHFQKDVIKLNCINDKLVQMRPQLNIADRAYAQILNGDAKGVNDLMAAAESCRKLREGADLCAGEPLLGTKSNNSWSHPNIPDPTDGNPWGPVFEPPVYCSPDS